MRYGPRPLSCTGLCGNCRPTGETIRGLATARNEAGGCTSVRLAAAQALGSFKGESMVETLASLASLKETPSIRAAALDENGGLPNVTCPKRSAQLASALLAQVKADDMDVLLSALLTNLVSCGSEGANALADAMGKKKLPVDGRN